MINWELEPYKSAYLLTYDKEKAYELLMLLEQKKCRND